MTNKKENILNKIDLMVDNIEDNLIEDVKYEITKERIIEELEEIKKAIDRDLD